MVKTVTFMLCIFCHNEKKKITVTPWSPFGKGHEETDTKDVQVTISLATLDHTQNNPD